jgi:Flp pilus assembly pilin Flp
MFRREDGQAMAEYSLILALVALVVLVGYEAIGPLVSQMIQSIADGF